MKIKNLLAVLAGAALMAGGIAPANAESLQIKGSDTVLPLSQRWAEAFMAKNRGTSISVTGGGSGVGIKALLR